MNRLRYFINITLGVTGLGLGAGAMYWLIQTGANPEYRQTPAPLPTVRVARIEPQTLQEPVVGYGTVKPRKQINIMPQISGILTQVHPGLAVGNSIDKGELLFQVDDRTYRSQVAQVNAGIRQLEVQLDSLEQERKGLSHRLATAREQLELADENYTREKQLLTEGATRQMEKELAQERYLLRKDAVIAYEAQLDMIPFKIEEADARLQGMRAQLEEAQRNVERTRIECPFDARVEVVAAQQSQSVLAYFSMATLTELEAFEIPTVIDPQDIIWAHEHIRSRVMGRFTGEMPDVTVAWTGMGGRLTWKGTVSRLERHDEATRTDRIVIEVNNVELNATEAPASLRPNLSPGMFVSVELPAEPLEGALVLSRSSIQDDQWVYVFEPDGGDAGSPDGRLAIRRVPTLRTLGDRVLVHFEAGNAMGAGTDLTTLSEQLASCELRPGEEVVLTPLSKPVLGMRLRKDNSNPSASFIPLGPIGGERFTLPSLLKNPSTSDTLILASSPIQTGSH